ncbi:MAG: hypothetical protein ACR2L1_03885 [Pyrinomonadaceae bacterium]
MGEKKCFLFKIGEKHFFSVFVSRFLFISSEGKSKLNQPKFIFGNQRHYHQTNHRRVRFFVIRGNEKHDSGDATRRDRILKSGRGNLFNRTEKLKEPGIKSSREISRSMINFDTEFDGLVENKDIY